MRPNNSALFYLWGLFWLLMVAVALQDERHSPGVLWWQPLLWEGSSCLVGTVWLLLERRMASRWEPLLGDPLRWFGRHFAWLPVVVVTFIVSVYAIRHGVYALAGLRYEHDPWPQVFFYESLKLLLFSGLWFSIIFGLSSFGLWKRERERLLTLQKHLAESQLSQLRAQLQPHFLFNALNTISSLMQVDVERADRLLAQLADLLRSSLQVGERQMTSLRAELALLDLYARIMQERFAGRVTLSHDIADDTLEAEVPAMLLQPLLENAYKHGVELSSQPVAIAITARRDEAQLQVTVRNSGELRATAGGAGIGLRNCRERLELLFGERAALELVQEGGAVVAKLTLPLAESRGMIRVLVVDDEAPARDKLRRWLAEQADIELLGEAADGLAAAVAIEKLAPDVVFLDIQMPGLSGLEVAAQLEPERAPLLVFVTAFDEHAIKAFELNAIDYLLKPYDRDRLRRTLERIRERQGAPRPDAASAVRAARAQTGSSERLLVPQGEELQLIEASSIHWLAADDNYVHVHTAVRSYMLRRTLADLIAQLGEQRFVRIHRSTAVNLAEVASLSPLFKGDHEVRLRSGTTLRLSRRFKDELFARMPR